MNREDLITWVLLSAIGILVMALAVTYSERPT